MFRLNYVSIIRLFKEFNFFLIHAKSLKNVTQWLKAMLIGCRAFSSLSKYIVQWKTSYQDIFNPLIMYFQSHNVCFFPRFGRILYFCSNNGPLPNAIFSALYLKNSLLPWKLKSKEMTECLKLQNWTRPILQIAEQGKKLKFESLLLMTYVEKSSYLEIVPPCHTMLTNTHG